MKYFLNKNGVTTERMAGKPGAGHIDIAKAFLGDPGHGDDVYEQMFALGFARVREDAENVFVDAPRGLTKKQDQFMAEKRSAGKQVIINDKNFIQTRQMTQARRAT